MKKNKRYASADFPYAGVVCGDDAYIEAGEIIYEFKPDEDNLQVNAAKPYPPCT